MTGGPRGLCPPPIHPGQKEEFWQSWRQGGPVGFGPPIDMHGPPIKKITLLKTAAFVLNFKLWLPPDERLAPLSRLLCCRLWILVFRINTCHCVLFSCFLAGILISGLTSEKYNTTLLFALARVMMAQPQWPVNSQASLQLLKTNLL